MRAVKIAPAVALAGIAALSIVGIRRLPAQPAARPTAPAPPSAARPKGRVWFGFRQGAREETPQGAINTCRGNAVFLFTRKSLPPDVRTKELIDFGLKDDDSRLTTDLATFNERTQIAASPGKLKLEDEYNTVTGNTGTAFYKTKEAKIRGDVVMVARPREENQNAPSDASQRRFDSPVTLTCQKVDYNWRTRIALASERLTIKQKDMTVTADRAVYDGRKEMILLEGNVLYVRTNGERGKTPKATIYYTKGKERFLTEQLSGQYPVDEEEIEREEGAPPGNLPPSSPPAATPSPERPEGVPPR
ncbi:MAG: hypothetical protein SFU56_21635 [Capsulimonadales bacterium]|nr:hypothetical protein [Capsulimonadales bacterium]